MKHGIYLIAGHYISIDSLYDDVHEYCKDYRAESDPDLSVVIDEADIEYERIRSTEDDPVRTYFDEYLEKLAVYRKIAEIMPEYDTVLFHGSAVSVDGCAYLFTAKSGTGKSTHARLWREMLGEKAVMVNDDKPLIRVADDQAVVYGTPWNGKHRLGNNIAVPLKAVCVLQRGTENHIEQISSAEAWPHIMQQTYRPADLSAMTKTMVLLDRLTKCVSFYRLSCNMDPEAAYVSYTGMKG
ncbi:MAG: hypothetical protein K6F23_06580 [Solobacterium sp.]|nr:hypothetical protein [Solobacterium sp.]